MRALLRVVIPAFAALGWPGAGLCAELAKAAATLSYDDLPGWAEDDQSSALRAFQRTCGTSRPAWLCHAAKSASGDAAAARAFFERWFEPVAVESRGFLTGYFEPELDGSLIADATYRIPLLAPPTDLVAKPGGPPPSDWPPGLTAAQRTGSGYEPYPDRAAIEEGALGALARPVAFLADPVDAFMVHVQGSARIRLPGGRAVRVGFAGRNGQPYMAIGRILADAEGVPAAEMTAGRLYAWLKANPDRAPAIMRTNRSYIFFRRIDGTRPGDGPIGGAGVPLTAGRSVAVDRAHTRYGTPVWLDGETPVAGGGLAPLRRLVVAQDTGAAIVGRGRGDLFEGSGAEAGQRAGLLRHSVTWIELRPRPIPARARPRPTTR